MAILSINRSMRQIHVHVVNISGLSIVNALGWMTVTQLRNYFMGVLMHRCIYGNTPDYIKYSILSVSDVHDDFTRSLSSGDLYIPHPNREIFKQSFLYNSPLVWNSLPGALKVLSCHHVLREIAKCMF